jgi:hypothetical protein
MKKTKRVQRWSVLVLIIATAVLMGWSVSRPMPRPLPALPPGIALAQLSEAPRLSEPEDGSDFINPLRFPARPPAKRIVPSSKLQVQSSETEAPAHRPAPSVIPGRAIRLEPKGSLTVSLSGRIEFVATLVNIQTDPWRVIGELYVTKGDGTSEKLFGPRAIQLGRAQTLRLPVGFTAKRFPPGTTQFMAVLKDQAGQVLDQAIITFTIELGQQ